MATKKSIHLAQPHCNLADFIGEPYQWSQRSDNGYEVTTQGDSRFSAFNAFIMCGTAKWSIENAYQVGVKGYLDEARSSKLPRGSWWRIGKGKPPKNGKCRQQLYNEYKALWIEWCDQNPELIHELSILAKGKVLTDQFAKGEINQAHALCDILNERYG